jgi:hypothetical protein
MATVYFLNRHSESDIFGCLAEILARSPERFSALTVAGIGAGGMITGSAPARTAVCTRAIRCEAENRVIVH